MTDRSRAGQALIDRLQHYLGNGGLWNPEMMDHNQVRDLLVDIRDYLTESGRRRATAPPAPPVMECTCNSVTGGRMYPTLTCPIHGSRF